MDLATFSQLSPLAALIFIVWFTIKYFTETIRRKDEHISLLVKEFNITINTHLRHETETLGKLEQAIRELTKEIKNGH